VIDHITLIYFLFVIDTDVTGVIDHVTLIYFLFVSYYKIKHVDIKLYNNIYVIAKVAGTIIFLNIFLI